ncbi:hypothetical protein TNCV_2193301 [Trichonephila clavipes]|nr:hypothetical protein TNCV_2193301 [Trichonephila clavipes]
MHVHHDAAKHGDCPDAVNKARIHLKKCHLAIRTPKLIVDHTIEDAFICDAASRVAATMVYELRVFDYVNVIELFVNTFVAFSNDPNT